MELQTWCLLIFASHALGQALLSVLETHLELSTLNYYINASTKLSGLLLSANNFTLLAPSNTAFEEWLSNQDNRSLRRDVIDATLTYHLLHGSFPTASFSDEPQFVTTGLENSTYANVTSGQRVELVSGSNGQPQALSGNKSVTAIASPDVLCTGGIIKIVNTVLTIPFNSILLSAAANLSFFTAILSKGGFLTAEDAGLISNVAYAPNMTFFAPNTAAAVAAFTATSAGMSQADLAAVFNYHIIPGLGYSPLLRNGTVLQTVQGSNVTITRHGPDIYVNAAKIIASDYLVANGVVHVIDSLLDRFNTSGPTLNPSPTPAPVEHSHSSISKVGIGIGVSMVSTFLVIFTYFLIRFLRQRKYPHGQSTVTEGSLLMRFLKPFKSKQRGATGKPSQILGQDFELDATSVPSLKIFEVSAVELDGKAV